MNGTSVAPLKNFCRTCMKANNENGGRISIFTEIEFMECNHITVIELLLATIPQLNIDKGDMLPKILCDSCLENLISAYKFQKMCLEVEHKLQQMVNGECPAECQTSNKDPLKDIPIETIAASPAIYDLTKFLKIEMDEPLIDQNESGVVSKKTDTTDGAENIKPEADDDKRWKETSDSDESNDTDSDWETKLSKAKRRKGLRPKVKKVKEKIESSCEEKQNLGAAEETEINSNLHLAKEVESKKFSCEECGNLLKTRKSLMRHKKIHLRNINAKDEHTTLQKIEDAKNGADLANSNKEDENKKIICDECGNCFTTLKSLKRHEKIHLKPAAENNGKSVVNTKFECKFCKKVFAQGSMLNDHLRTHSGERPFLCSECGKSFSTAPNLKQHSFCHLNEKQFSCPDCPKLFTTKTNLASHYSVHKAKPKKHICDICSRGFPTPFLLKKHKMYHTNDRPFSCEYCDKSFITNEKLRRHVRIHTGEKPFKCSYCEKAYCQSSELTNHLRKHLGGNVYQCELCPQRFPSAKSVREHFYTHKNDDEETKARNLAELNAMEIKGVHCR